MIIVCLIFQIYSGKHNLLILTVPQIEGAQLPSLPKPRGRVYPVRPKVTPEKQRKAIEVK